MWSSNLTPGHIARQNCNSKRHLAPVFTAALFTIAKNLNAHQWKNGWRRCGTIYYSAIKKEWNNAICSNMAGSLPWLLCLPPPPDRTPLLCSWLIHPPQPATPPRLEITVLFHRIEPQRSVSFTAISPGPSPPSSAHSRSPVNVCWLNYWIITRNIANINWEPLSTRPHSKYFCTDSSSFNTTAIWSKHCWFAIWGNGSRDVSGGRAHRFEPSMSGFGACKLSHNKQVNRWMPAYIPSWLPRRTKILKALHVHRGLLLRSPKKGRNPWFGACSSQALVPPSEVRVVLNNTKALTRMMGLLRRQGGEQERVVEPRET